MSTMNISLPELLKAFVDERVSTDGYSTSSEYVRELIRADQVRRADPLHSEEYAVGRNQQGAETAGRRRHRNLQAVGEFVERSVAGLSD